MSKTDKNGAALNELGLGIGTENEAFQLYCLVGRLGSSVSSTV